MSSQKESFDYDMLEEFCERAFPDVEAAELHGMLVGQICAKPQITATASLKVLSSTETVATQLQEQDQRVFEYLLEFSRSRVEDKQLGFYPVLPEDDEDLPIRVAALAYWCQGFLAGFALSQKDKIDLPELVEDAFKDIAAISQAGLEDDEAGSEADYNDVLEYVRVAVLNILAELHPEVFGLKPDADLAAPNAAAQAPGKAPAEQPAGSVQNLFKPKLH
jgi:hypothetical protein